MMADWLSSLAGVVVDASVRACAVAAVVAVLLAVGRVRASSAVHTAWCFVVCTMLLMPVLPQWAPALPIVPVPEIPAFDVASVPPGRTGSGGSSSPDRNGRRTHRGAGPRRKWRRRRRL